MRKLSMALLPIAAVFLAGASLAQTAAEHAMLEKWRLYEGVSWDTPKADGGVSRYSGSVTAPIAGLHFDKKGTAYVSTPRLLSPNAPATISILDLDAKEGPARLTAFPSVSANSTGGPVSHSLRNVLGFYVDNRNGWLWALDMGFVAGEAEAPAGAQKLLVLELGSGKVVKSIPLDGVADRKGSFLNDVAIDEKRRIAYLSDSGFRSAPNNMAGIIVVDFVSAKVRRVLDRHPAVLYEPGMKVYSHGEEVWPGNPLLVAINGIALSPDGETLYWTVTAGDKLRALPTSVLRNFKSSDKRVAAAVHELGTVGGNTDGIVTDKSGKLYITDVTHNGIAVYDPKQRGIEVQASSDGVYWPDTAAIGPDDALYFTASNLNNHFAGAVKQGQERYEIWKMPLSAGKTARQ
jgi:sugar lactone lactonase YvrE